ncbi:MAG: uncharacterized protein KVP18_001026 [Porospora cf. gigantea A]|nr:MAG: hypothetical protein KVP18_001026 [Porospora cf. gigantea A]
MWGCSIFYLRYFYYCFLLSAMLNLNVLYSIVCALVPDSLDDELIQKSSSIVAAQGLLGSASGFLLLLATSGSDYHFIYPVFVVIMAFCLRQTELVAEQLARAQTPPTPSTPSTSASDRRIRTLSRVFFDFALDSGDLGDLELESLTDIKPAVVSVTSPSEDDTLPLPLRFARYVRSDFDLADLKECYTIDVSHSYDFLWVFCGRTAYYVAVSVQAFIQYFLRDIVGTLNEHTQQEQVGYVALASTFSAAVFAFLFGQVMQRVAHMPLKPPIYASCFIMALVYAAFVLTPFFAVGCQRSKYQNRLAWILSVSVLYGAGNGCFLSVDYALAIETLPDKLRPAQALGIWGVSGFIGSAIGPLLWGIFLALDRADPPQVYGPVGYAAMMVGGVSFTGVAAIFVSKVSAVS